MTGGFDTNIKGHIQSWPTKICLVVLQTRQLITQPKCVLILKITLLFCGYRLNYESTIKHNFMVCFLTTASEKEKQKKVSFPFCLIFSPHLNINPCSCWSAVDCGIEEAPDRSIIVEGLQQQGDRSLARKYVAQKADK